MTGETSTRSRILAAAQELAHEMGAGHISLDAVAARAGVSKGGLLYHFPSKAKLLEGLVEQFLSGFNRALEEREKELSGETNSVLRAYLDLFCAGCSRHDPPPTGLLAALAENPAFLAPVKRFERKFLDRTKADAPDPTLALVIYLAINGLRSMEVLNVQVVTPEETGEVIEKMIALITRTPASPR